MYGGRIVTVQRARDAVVAEFIGTMNRLEGTVVDGGVDHGGRR